jgi:hypothetical protein
MEYVDGPSLAAVVRERGRLALGDAVDYIAQAARGLAYAHTQGVIHRDMKPGNLLLDGTGTVKILDMGLARLDQRAGEQHASNEEPLTECGQVMGTSAYMAPEQIEDAHSADHRADIYALGCTLYHFLTGEPPYQETTPMRVMLAHRESPIPSLRIARHDVPEALDAISQRMMAKRPEDRQQSAIEVVTDLEACNVFDKPRRDEAVRPSTAASMHESLAQTVSVNGSAKPTTANRFGQVAEEPTAGQDRQTGGSGVAVDRRRRRTVTLALAAVALLAIGVFGAVVTLIGSRDNRDQQSQNHAELAQRRQRQVQYITAVRPAECEVVEARFRKALAMLDEAHFDDDKLASLLAVRSEQVRLLADLKARIVNEIKDAEPHLSVTSLGLPDPDGRLVDASEESITVEWETGNREQIVWRNLDLQAMQKLVEMVSDHEDANDWLSAGLLALLYRDVHLSQSLIGEARSRGADVDRHVESIVATTLVHAVGLWSNGFQDEAKAFVSEIEKSVGQECSFARLGEDFEFVRGMVDKLNQQRHSFQETTVHLVHCLSESGLASQRDWHGCCTQGNAIRDSLTVVSARKPCRWSRVAVGRVECRIPPVMPGATVPPHAPLALGDEAAGFPSVLPLHHRAKVSTRIDSTELPFLFSNKAPSGRACWDRSSSARWWLLFGLVRSRR